MSEVEEDQEDGEEEGDEAAEDNDGRGDDHWKVLLPLNVGS